ncbi:hypothetical protein HBH51_172120 [Parastagonospora nodorum]|nr:hypothetical protein HBH51_172120 [Parastagonospora nodorum]KAH6413444.1 hypothetical protein HBI08_131580 [Parastagonospora nodorum]
MKPSKFTHNGVIMSTQRSAPPLPPRKMPNHMEALAARISKLRNVMSILREDRDSLKFLAYLVQHYGLYCQTCSRKRKPGGCGPTCPLLRPESYTKKYGSTLLWNIRDNGGLQNIVEQIRQYDLIASDMERWGNNVSLYELGQWEHLTNSWLRRGLNLSYRMGDAPMPITHQFHEVDWAGVKPRDQAILEDEEYRQPASPTDTQKFLSDNLAPLQDD